VIKIEFDAQAIMDGIMHVIYLILKLPVKMIMAIPPQVKIGAVVFLCLVGIMFAVSMYVYWRKHHTYYI